MKSARDFLDSAHYGPGWSLCVDAWAALEEEYNFFSPVTGFTNHRRPEQVVWWVSRGRNPSRSLPIKNLKTFIADWEVWWASCNPAWRHGDRPGLPMKQSTEGTLEALRVPGKNGLLGVLACLKWWRDAEHAATPQWTAALEDVSWAIHRRLAEERGSP
ncbi:hypothetical protein PLICRDRAFT_112687 [Plicaturopsis crispa FD-325 SS-3]|nr:hypothetical protein PLICRDRAFT_112687 [Plicaturopsis crispa FD-325 SS-3]